MTARRKAPRSDRLVMLAVSLVALCASRRDPRAAFDSFVRTAGFLLRVVELRRAAQKGGSDAGR